MSDALPETPEVVHACPPEGSSTMPCCGVLTFERLGDRIALDPAAVTCCG